MVLPTSTYSDFHYYPISRGSLLSPTHSARGTQHPPIPLTLNSPHSPSNIHLPSHHCQCPSRLPLPCDNWGEVSQCTLEILSGSPLLSNHPILHPFIPPSLPVFLLPWDFNRLLKYAPPPFPTNPNPSYPLPHLP